MLRPFRASYRVIEHASSPAKELNNLAVLLDKVTGSKHHDHTVIGIESLAELHYRRRDMRMNQSRHHGGRQSDGAKAQPDWFTVSWILKPEIGEILRKVCGG